MESGLEDRNNSGSTARVARASARVSMESGLEDRNNDPTSWFGLSTACSVSMESGLEDRNNSFTSFGEKYQKYCLNGVRPRRPEQ